MKRWLLLALFPGLAFGQVHTRQPFNFAWDYTQGAAERFELKLDTGAYVSVGLPPFAAGTYTLTGDPALTGSHSAVVRACTAALGCSFDSNTLAFIVDVPAPAPIPAAPTNVRLVASIAPPGPVESPNLTKVTAPGIGSIIDATLDVWSLGPKDPAVEGGLEYVLLRNGSSTFPPPQPTVGVLFLCYTNHAVVAFSQGSWFQWNGTFLQNIWPTVPAGC